MSATDRLERDLAVWFEETAVPNVPEYVDEIVQVAVRGRQRPRWTFVGRWVPGAVARLSLPRTPVRWRTVVVLAILALLLAVGLVLVGSRPRLPPPFGLAQNGLVVVSRDGDIIAVDPVTRVETPIVTGPEEDLDPMWSLDGTRLSFIRRVIPGDRIGFVDRDGARPIFSTQTLFAIDTDSISWSPDGRRIAVYSGGYFLVDAATGQVERLPLRAPELEIFWRPPDGREIVYRTLAAESRGLVLYSLETGTATKLVPDTGPQVRPRGWSPDGRRFVFHTLDARDRPLKTYVFDLETRKNVEIDAAAGRLSNDGTRVAAYDFTGPVGRLCVAPADGRGPCDQVGSSHEPDITYGDALNWSPNDEWIIVYPLEGDQVILIDPNGNEDDIVIAADGAGSWQRVMGP
jgi:WD40-like Beta Propeller Repeat